MVLCEFESRSGEVYSIYHYVIKFVSDLRQVDGFFRVFRFPPPIKTDCHDITKILLIVALNTITLTLNSYPDYNSYSGFQGIVI
jgi:hypothetical protein